MTLDNKYEKKKQTSLKRRWSRLAAIQAIYQYDFSNNDIEKIVEEFLLYRIPLGKENLLDNDLNESVDSLLKEMDMDHFSKLAKGAVILQEPIDKLLSEVLTESWSLERLDPVLKAILRVAAFEILHCDDVPKKVSISEFMAISDTFYGDKEPAFINGILDKVN